MRPAQKTSPALRVVSWIGWIAVALVLPLGAETMWRLYRGGNAGGAVAQGLALTLAVVGVS